MGHNFISGSANPPQVVFQPHVCVHDTQCVMQILDNCGRVKLSRRASQAQPQLCIIAVIPANEREREEGRERDRDGESILPVVPANTKGGGLGTDLSVPTCL